MCVRTDTQTRHALEHQQLTKGQSRPHNPAGERVDSCHVTASARSLTDSPKAFGVWPQKSWSCSSMG